ncbi:MAG: hypothetical protein COT81_05255 [Candidatus Buchananbacteria bacterium CG10_big_fil_rev_8_21_14_0_10_42_9]|uniref:Uncharacterized protein n=1 Tax=Candidatus Buchananbacteria bacterium CG10_big_fil_rev_8_21_14_0_10_42_9 TaxID=1974526 RepID=A0A2H0VZX8_9BACT|nr:MAG: hypothetical protein COT81_05255 [Candidatus Buchananbacteria bacterium CG10_big_fil_rev_8_21_14_0_10_42_9]
MNIKIEFITRVVLLLLIIASAIFILILTLIFMSWGPELLESKNRVMQTQYKLNKAQCLESYYNQGQAPLGACGYDF